MTQREAILSVVFASDRSRRGGHTRPVEGAVPRVRGFEVNEQRGSIVKTMRDGLLLGSASSSMRWEYFADGMVEKNL